MTSRDFSTASNPDLLRGSLAAMRRAARAARKLALQTNTSLVRVRAGVVVRVGPEQMRAELAAEDASDGTNNGTAG